MNGVFVLLRPAKSGPGSRLAVFSQSGGSKQEIRAMACLLARLNRTSVWSIWRRRDRAQTIKFLGPIVLVPTAKILGSPWLGSRLPKDWSAQLANAEVMYDDGKAAEGLGVGWRERVGG